MATPLLELQNVACDRSVDFIIYSCRKNLYKFDNSHLCIVALSWHGSQNTGVSSLSL